MPDQAFCLPHKVLIDNFDAGTGLTPVSDVVQIKEPLITIFNNQ